MSDHAKRLRNTLGGVSVPEHMHGDNLAILLCSSFEDPDGEQDENGWTEAATDGCDKTLDAIHAHYADRIEALEAALLAADELARAVDHERNMVYQDMGLQMKVSDAVDAALLAYRKATGGAG